MEIEIWVFYIDNGRLRKSNYDENWKPTKEAIDKLCEIMKINW